MNEQKKEPGWQDLPIGCVMMEARSTRHYHTGDWRSQIPVTDAEICCSCGLCWVYCPDCSRYRDLRTGKYDVNNFFCKGCGICARECPTGAIKMAEEET